jgi:membrane protease YdiL (CAAX protease family)
LQGENVFPSRAVTSLFIPWDFAVILIFLGVIVPWRGNARMKRLLSKEVLTTADRLSLYKSTILFQWLIVAVVAWRCAARAVDLDELGIATANPWQLAWVTVALAGLLCLNQLAGLSRLAKTPEDKRGRVIAVTKSIMPRGSKETLIYAALACTAGISEEFLYRGFVFMAFVRMIVNYGPPNIKAAILSSAWFALAHLYQGRRGVITTFVVGMIFVSIRIWTGSLLPAVAAHIGIDLVAGIGLSRFLRKASGNA